jgi:hypothetical protein
MDDIIKENFLSNVFVIKTILMHHLSSVYFVNQPLHVSGIFVAHHQEVYYRYIQNNWYLLGFSVACLLIYRDARSTKHKYILSNDLKPFQWKEVYLEHTELDQRNISSRRCKPLQVRRIWHIEGQNLYDNRTKELGVSSLHLFIQRILQWRSNFFQIKILIYIFKI